MKREVTYTDVEQTCSHILSPKRRKLLNSSDHCCRSTIEPQSSRTLHLTPETLGELSSQSPAPTNSIESIEQWASNCDSCSQSEMATSITSNDSSQRRVSKLNYRRQRSQSPTKKTSTQYRSRNMADASIFVDHFPEPPSDVENQIKNIFGVSALENIGQAPSDHSQVSASAIKNDIDEFAKKYCHRSRQMAKDCVGEGQWKSCLLTGLVEPMQELWPEILKMSASEKRRSAISVAVTWLTL